MMPIPAAAITSAFDRPVRPEDRDASTARVAAFAPLVEPKTESVLLFRVGAEWFGLGTDRVAGIAPVLVSHSLPAPRSGIGLHLVNVDGELLVAVALGALLGIASTPPGEPGSTARMVVTNAKLVFLADEVFGVHRYHRDALRPVPATLDVSSGARTVGLLEWEGASVARLDDEVVMSAMAQALS